MKQSDSIDMEGRVFKVKDVAEAIESWAPLCYQDSYDNSGLQVGDPQDQVDGILVALDLTMDVLQEAELKGCNVIVTHHPLLFHTPRTFTGRTLVERMTMRAIRSGISVYSAHTSLDNAPLGVSHEMALRIGLKDIRPLKPLADSLLKLTVQVPEADLEPVRKALLETGCGRLGQYGDCASWTPSRTVFRPLEGSVPYLGKAGELTGTDEARLEVCVPVHLRYKAEQALLKAHPYQQPAYGFQKLDGPLSDWGSGVLGDLEIPLEREAFLDRVSDAFPGTRLAYSADFSGSIRTVALCGGAGAFLASSALKAGAQAFLTGEISYHQYFTDSDQMMLVSMGHYQSEQFTVDLLMRILDGALDGMRVEKSAMGHNPVAYH